MVQQIERDLRLKIGLSEDSGGSLLEDLSQDQRSRFGSEIRIGLIEHAKPATGSIKK